MLDFAADAITLIYWISAILVVGMILTGELTPNDGYKDPREFLWLVVFIFMPIINALIAGRFICSRWKLLTKRTPRH